MGCQNAAKARLGDDADVFEAIQSGNLAHTNDAILVATALIEGCPIVIADGSMTKRALRRGIQVISPTELLARFGFVVRFP